jgi:glycosyltransferase involved in cell wall biosynthesis
MYSVALTMIVRNESANLKRCLDSARLFVDSLIVVDTGSTDDTMHIAGQAGARVDSFKWVNDFGAARNYSLNIANADWNLILDADESIVDGGLTIASLRNVKPDFVGTLRVDSDIEADGNKSRASSWIARVLPRGVMYTGRIHEQPVHRLPIKNLPVHILHTGYLPKAMLAKKGRNSQLLESELHEFPEDGYLLYQLGKDYAVYHRYEDAVRVFAQADGVLGSGHRLGHDLLLRWLFALKKLARFEIAVELAESRMELWAESPDYWFVVGDLLLDFACSQPEKADALIPMIETSWLRSLEIGERPDLEGAVRGRGSYLAAQNLAVIYEGTGHTAKALQYREIAKATMRFGVQ